MPTLTSITTSSSVNLPSSVETEVLAIQYPVLLEWYGASSHGVRNLVPRNKEENAYNPTFDTLK